MIVIGLDERELERGLASARKKVRKFDDDTDGTRKRRKDKGGGGLGMAAVTGGVAGIAAQATGAVSGFVASTIDELFAFEDQLSRLQIAAGKSNFEMLGLRSSILAISRATGVAKSDILGGAQTYIDLTGDVAGAENAMSSFARIAQASGAQVSDVATAAAALQQSLQLDSRDIEAAFSGLIMQGKAGAVSLKDLAGELSAVAPRFAKFGGSGVEGIADLGAALQVARQGFGSASEAATGLEALMGALALNADKFQGAGVKIFKTGKDGRKTFRGFVDIIDAIGRSRLVKDPTALAKAFGSKEALQAFDMLSGHRQELEKIYQTGLDAGAVQRDLDTRLQNSAGKITLAVNAAKVSIAEAFTPERIEAFAQSLGKAAGWFAEIVGSVDKLATFLGDDDKLGGDTAAQFAATGLTHDETGKARPREEARKLIQQAARGESVDTFNFVAADTPALRKRAAEIAAKELGLTATGREFLGAESDPWARAGTGTGAGGGITGVFHAAGAAVHPTGAATAADLRAAMKGLAQDFAVAVAGALHVQVDGNTVATATANARVQRQPRPGR